MADQKRQEVYRHNEDVTIKFVDAEDWGSLCLGAKQVKAFVYPHYVDSICQVLDPSPRHTIMTIDDGTRRLTKERYNKYVTRIAVGAEQTITDLVGFRNDGKAKGFLLLDSHILIVQ